MCLVHKQQLFAKGVAAFLVLGEKRLHLKDGDGDRDGDGDDDGDGVAGLTSLRTASTRVWSLKGNKMTHCHLRLAGMPLASSSKSVGYLNN
jgi:hypothetical protein